MNAPPRVSVIMPTHNRPGLLTEAIESVMVQTFEDFELIVVDDGSQPQVPMDTLIQRFGPRLHGRRHLAPRGGPVAKSIGVLEAKSEILAFLDDDDLYAPQYLEKAVEVLDRYPNIGVVFMGVSWFGTSAAWGITAYDKAMRLLLEKAEGQEVEPCVHLFGELLVAALLDRVPMAFQRPVVRREVFEKIGNYRPDCLLWDCDWAIRAAIAVPCALISEGLYRQRSGQQGLSSRPSRKLEQMQSNAEIKERLLGESVEHSDMSDLLHRSAAKAWFDIAYHHLSENKCFSSLNAWQRSRKLCPQVASKKLLARIALCGLGLGKRKTAD